MTGGSSAQPGGDGGGGGDTCQALPTLCLEHNPPARLKSGLGLGGVFQPSLSRSLSRLFAQGTRASKGWGAESRTCIPQTPGGSQQEARPVPPRSARRDVPAVPRAHPAPLGPAAGSARNRKRRRHRASLPGKHVGLRAGLGRGSGPGGGETARDLRGGSGGFTAPPSPRIV